MMGITATSLVGARPFSWIAAIATSRRLRILAYHGISDLPAFEQHVHHLARHYRPVSGEQVASALRGQRSLPARAAWVTFDDGHPEVVTGASQLLRDHGIQATLFVCPGMVDTTTPYWWESVRHAEALGISVPGMSGSPAAPAEAALKLVPDAERRRIVRDLQDQIERRTGQALERPQMTSDQARTWLADGHQLANHTWDHPLLDRCPPAEQVEQIARADEWLRGIDATSAALFAYPNGNWSAVAEEELQRRGYLAAVGFDHRLARASSDPLRLSRLRVDASAPLSRFRSIVAGTHPFLLRRRNHLLSGSGTVTDPRELPT